MREAQLLLIGSLRFSTKKRRGISQKRVGQLRQDIEWGKDVMPIRVNALGDGTYIVKDGRHRIQAHLEAGMDCLYAFVDNLCMKIKKLFSYLFSMVDLRVDFFLADKKQK